MSLTVQAATTVFVASLVSFFMSQTGWQRPNMVQVPTSSFNVQEAKDDILQEVLSKLHNTKDQQETTGYLTFEQYDNDKENQKQFYEAQLKKQADDLKTFYQKSINMEKNDLEKGLKGQYENLLKKEVESLTRFYEDKLQATNSTLHKEFEDKLQVVHEQCQVNISNVNNTVLKSLDDARSELTEKHQKLGDEVGAMPKTLEERGFISTSELRQQATSQTRQYEEQLQNLKREFEDKLLAVQNELDKVLKTETLALEARGFMNIETFGPILLAVVVGEVVLAVCVCGLLCPAAGRRGGTRPGQ